MATPVEPATIIDPSASVVSGTVSGNLSGTTGDSAQSGRTALAHAAYDSKIEGNVIFTQVDAAINWMRKNSLWPMPMGLACCAIELMATASSRFDISRLGA